MMLKIEVPSISVAAIVEVLAQEYPPVLSERMMIRHIARKLGLTKQFNEAVEKKNNAKTTRT